MQPAANCGTLSVPMPAAAARFHLFINNEKALLSHLRTSKTRPAIQEVFLNSIAFSVFMHANAL